MDDEPQAPKAHMLGDDLSRMSIRELEALKAACLSEAERITQEIKSKGETRVTADSFFRI
ncbi:DUF1192 domain-containing protein [Acuticoccus sp. M5D2P5]|uniref:DUF1192 domain-containing protein n=1 Tax=Acuticoccus kalidii TaxID=2910977 RepID=UPI001F2AC1FB|nr:DUF1192 domain-containing protein [Acuticoccus kalidii]MCF3932766.1 DUF1192 domain-containing protein [Acuticoccus kalidii]